MATSDHPITLTTNRDSPVRAGKLLLSGQQQSLLSLYALAQFRLHGSRPFPLLRNAFASASAQGDAGPPLKQRKARLPPYAWLTAFFPGVPMAYAAVSHATSSAALLSAR